MAQIDLMGSINVPLGSFHMFLLVVRGSNPFLHLMEGAASADNDGDSLKCCDKRRRLELTLSSQQVSLRERELVIEY